MKIRFDNTTITKYLKMKEAWNLCWIVLRQIHDITSRYFCPCFDIGYNGWTNTGSLNVNKLVVESIESQSENIPVVFIHLILFFNFQVIVVVFDNWEVQCYDSNLQLLWKNMLMKDVQPRDMYQVKSMGILIASHALAKGHKGMVIVGGSLEHVGHSTRYVEKIHTFIIKMF